MFTPLSAMTRFPSRVVIMLRTTPPPPGMIQVWNFSVLGSNRTSVLGRTADSLYGHVVERRDAVGLRLWPARRRPFLDVPGARYRGVPGSLSNSRHTTRRRRS